jgi:pimeloyl-ACP methyl ester carboxylesterase
LKGIILIGTGARLRVRTDIMDLCATPGEDNADWIEGQKHYYEGVEQDIYQVLMRRASEVGPAVELNDFQACDNFDIMDEVSNIHLPTQVVCGSDDEMTPVKYSDYLGSQISEADVQVIPGGTHYVQLEKYQKVNEQIERFLGSLK